VSHGAVKELFEIFYVEQGVRWQVLRKLRAIRKSDIETFVQMSYAIVFQKRAIYRVVENFRKTVSVLELKEVQKGHIVTEVLC